MLEEAALAEPFVTYNSELQALLVSGLEDALSARAKERSQAGEVRAALRHSMSGDRPTLDKIAKVLGVSSRTLQRRLGHEGTAYQSLLDEVRHESARRLLAKTDVEAEEVAFLLGFEEYNSFTRAFSSLGRDNTQTMARQRTQHTARVIVADSASYEPDEPARTMTNRRSRFTSGWPSC